MAAKETSRGTPIEEEDELYRDSTPPRSNSTANLPVEHKRGSPPRRDSGNEDDEGRARCLDREDVGSQAHTPFQGDRTRVSRFANLRLDMSLYSATTLLDNLKVDPQSDSLPRHGLDFQVKKSVVLRARGLVSTALDTVAGDDVLTARCHYYLGICGALLGDDRDAQRSFGRATDAKDCKEKVWAEDWLTALAGDSEEPIDPTPGPREEQAGGPSQPQTDGASEWHGNWERIPSWSTTGSGQSSPSSPRSAYAVAAEGSATSIAAADDGNDSQRGSNGQSNANDNDSTCGNSPTIPSPVKAMMQDWRDDRARRGSAEIMADWRALRSTPAVASDGNATVTAAIEGGNGSRRGPSPHSTASNNDSSRGSSPTIPSPVRAMMQDWRDDRARRGSAGVMADWQASHARTVLVETSTKGNWTQAILRGQGTVWDTSEPGNLVNPSDGSPPAIPSHIRAEMENWRRLYAPTGLVETRPAGNDHGNQTESNLPASCKDEDNVDSPSIPSPGSILSEAWPPERIRIAMEKWQRNQAHTGSIQISPVVSDGDSREDSDHWASPSYDNAFPSPIPHIPSPGSDLSETWPPESPAVSNNDGSRIGSDNRPSPRINSTFVSPTSSERRRGGDSSPPRIPTPTRTMMEEWRQNHAREGATFPSAPPMTTAVTFAPDIQDHGHDGDDATSSSPHVKSGRRRSWFANSIDWTGTRRADELQLAEEGRSPSLPDVESDMR